MASTTSFPRRPLAALVAVALVMACKDASGPLTPEAPFKLNPTSPVVIEAVAGRAVEVLPSVLVTDRAGTPVAGQKVVFYLGSGGGAVSGSVTISDARGVASLAGWTLGRVAGLNTVVAMSGSLWPIVFRANGTAGPLASIVKVGGDQQTAESGSPTVARPQVRVADSAGNPIHDLPVTFSVVSGGGLVVDGVVMSDSAGIATPGEWRLGAEGVNRIEARAGDLPPQTFSATAVASTVTCFAESMLPMQVTVSSTLAGAICKGIDGSPYVVFRFSVPQQGAFLFTLASPEFDTALELRSWHLLASNDNVVATTNSAIKAVLAPGTYTLVVRSATPASAGAFAIRAQPTTDNVNGCEEVFVMRGIVTRQLTTFTDCPLGEVEHTDRYLIYLPAGAQATVEAEDLSYSDHGITISTAEGTVLQAAITPSGYVHSLTFMAPVSAFYRIDISNRGDDGAEYRLKVR